MSNSKKRKDLDRNQLQFEFSFEERAVDHLAAKAALVESIGTDKVPHTMETYEEACVELAAAVKRAVREYGKRLKLGNVRERLVDEINKYFGASGGDEEAPAHTRMPLSIHMLNHYLSKPVEYPIPGAMLFAIQHITESLEPCKALVDAEGGEVISSDERQLLDIGRAEAAVYELNEAKRRLKKGLRR